MLQVRTQEEIMNECQVWWTITGNFGNMAPIDWSKSTARAKQLSTLNLSSNQQQREQLRRQQKNMRRGAGGPAAAATAATSSATAINTSGDDDDLEDEDDIVAADLDMHSLILTSNPQDSTVGENYCNNGPYAELQNESSCMFWVLPFPRAIQFLN